MNLLLIIFKRANQLTEISKLIQKREAKMNSLTRILLSLFLLIFPVTIGQAMQTQEPEFVLTDDLFEAISTIDIISLNIALASGADIDTVDANGKTPLMLASKIGNPRILKIILAHEPELDKQDNKGETCSRTIIVTWCES